MVAAALLIQWQSVAGAASEGGLVGAESVHVVRKGEFLIAIASRLGVSEKVIAADNGLKPPYRLNPGDRLRIDNRHIVPEPLADGILINLPQRMLFLFRGGRLMGAYPVGLGRADWRTPTGNFHVAHLERNKTWCVPKSIQEEMRREGKAVVTHVPPGPDNPLGEYWIGLSIPGYGIHGTIAPVSIYRMRTHGCIRLHPEDIALVYGGAYRGMPVSIIYAAALVARLPDGRVMAEVNPDVYNRGDDPLRSLREQAAAQGLTGAVDWARAAEIARAKDGIARDVGSASTPGERTSGGKMHAQFRRDAEETAQAGRLRPHR